VPYKPILVVEVKMWVTKGAKSGCSQFNNGDARRPQDITSVPAHRLKGLHFPRVDQPVEPRGNGRLCVRKILCAYIPFPHADCHPDIEFTFMPAKVLSQRPPVVAAYALPKVVRENQRLNLKPPGMKADSSYPLILYKAQSTGLADPAVLICEFHQGGWV